MGVTMETTMTATKTNTTNKQLVKDNLVRQGYIPIYVHDDQDSETLIEGAVEAGCMVLEYTCRRHDARQMIPWIKKEFPHVAVLGATMIDGSRTTAFLSKRHANFMTINEMVDRGVDGLVSFLRFRPQTFERHSDQLVMICGVSTPNEGIEQLELGADFLKVGVGSSAGADMVVDCRVATHFCLPFFVTGGMTAERTAQLIEVGAVLTSAGFDLILKGDIDAGTRITTKLVSKRIQDLVAAVDNARKQYQPQFHAAVHDGRNNPMSAGPWVS